MNVSEQVQCRHFPCADVVTARHTIPTVEIEPSRVKAVMICEAPPPTASDDFYAAGDPFYLQTTLQAFEQAGLNLADLDDLLNLGIYITTAVKCGKVGYGVSTRTVQTCSEVVLEKELALFPHTRVLLLMGSVAIKAMNHITRRQTGKRLIPSGSTYKIRRQEYSYQGVRVFPSYLQTGKSFLIEKSKQKMIAEDIRAALGLLQARG
jgi:hypothetical protein